ncbi:MULTISPECIES: general secretion pathway protein GspK [unclassified Pseudoalteromonas]|uniref:general secretion pathway protein GspK n=1 Tax=unclassified Pseudoalteromonas TaxID=194690 RepID=UPI00187DEB50|nr:type II secretion system protein GspK [Lelliottia steviae]UJX25898.1 general secretion pathway protein GspK [Pseudoalteromonas sp. CF6-2]
MKAQTGIALIQVLIISFILALLGIFINQSIQQQVKVTQQIQNKFAMRLELEEAETQLFSALLAHKKYPDTNSNNQLVKNWNFYGEEFRLSDSIFISLMDMKSLFSLNISSPDLIKNLLVQLNVEENTAQTFVSSLTDWKDENDVSRVNGAEASFYKQQGKRYVPRNGYLQSVNEAALIRGAEQIPKEYFARYFSTEMVTGFNPINAPEAILKAIIKDESTANKVLKRRAAGTLSSYDFYLLTGIEEGEFINFVTGSKIRVQLRVVLNGAQLSKQYILDATPRSYIKPMVFSQVSWNKS